MGVVSWASHLGGYNCYQAVLCHYKVSTTTGYSELQGLTTASPRSRNQFLSGYNDAMQVRAAALVALLVCCAGCRGTWEQLFKYHEVSSTAQKQPSSLCCNIAQFYFIFMIHRIHLAKRLSHLEDIKEVPRRLLPQRGAFIWLPVKCAFLLSWGRESRWCAPET